MLKTIKVLGLVAILGTASIVLPMHETNAQQKKKMEAKSEGTVVIKPGKDGKFRFTVRDGEGKLLAMSSPAGFKTTDDATAAIDALKKTLADAKVETIEE